MLWMRPMSARKNTAPAPVTMPITTAMSDSLTSPTRCGSLNFMARLSRAPSFGVQDLAQLPRQLFESERLRDELHVGVHDAVVDYGVAGIPRRVEHFQSGLTLDGLLGKLSSIDLRHHDVGKQQADIGLRAEDLERRCGAAGMQDRVSEFAEAFGRDLPCPL